MTSFQFRFISPLHLYPQSPPKLHPNVQPKPPCHGLTAQNLFSVKPKKKTRPILPQPQSGKSVFFCGRNPFEGVAAQCAAGGAKRPPKQVQGRSPWRAFGDFPRDGKVTRGLGRSAQIRGRRGYQPRTNSRGVGRSAQIRRRRGCQPRTNSPRGAEHGKAMLSRSARCRRKSRKRDGAVNTAPSLWCLCIGKLSD